MAFGVTTYIDPGSYQQEVLVPSGINIPAQPFAVCLVGTGSRDKRVTNEAVLRGVVKKESITLAGSSPYTTTSALSNRADRKLENTTVYKTLNGVETEVLDTYVNFEDAFVLGTVTGTVDISTTNAFGLEMDGVDPVTIIINHGAPAGATTLIGREITVEYDLDTTSGMNGAQDADLQDIADAINKALGDASAVGFGSDFSSVASIDGTTSGLRIDSTRSDSLSDVRLIAPIANDALDTIFGSAAGENRDAGSYVTIDDAVYSASATWKITYVNPADTQDPLEQTSDVNTLVGVGSAPGTTNFVEATDFQLTSNEVDWSLDAAAVVTGVAGTGATPPNFDLATDDTLVLVVDGKTGSISSSTNLSIDLNGLASSPTGYANPSTAGDATAAEVVANINAVLAAELGPRYASVASVVSSGGNNVVRLTSPTAGRDGSSIEVKAASTMSAHNEIFGGEQTALGTGKKPAIGSVYFVTYEYTRPTTDYDVPIRHFSVEGAHAQVGQPSASTAAYNPLAIAASIAFENGAEYIYTVQVDDAGTAGSPSRAEVLSALDGAATVAGATEVVVVGTPGTNLAIQTDLVNHVETQSGPTEKHYRRGFFGMPNDTAIGDKTQADTWIYKAAKTLQVSPSSPGRGRMFLVAPPQAGGVTRDVALDDGVVARIEMDSTYLAVATAARRTSLPGPAETLTRRTITGFNVDDITSPWKPSERKLLASNGVCVVSFDGGLLKFLDAMSTEGGGGGKTSFKVDSTSYQKDIITQKIDQALDANIVGIVPFDLASFILDIKLIIQGVLASEIGKGTIGPYKVKETGAIRAIDLRTDIRVSQDPNDPTTFNFAYWYYLRYPALRLFGEYSVDSAFFALAA